MITFFSADEFHRQSLLSNNPEVLTNKVSVHLISAKYFLLNVIIHLVAGNKSVLLGVNICFSLGTQMEL